MYRASSGEYWLIRVADGQLAIWPHEVCIVAQLALRISVLQERAVREFGNVSDFIWKAPRLIGHERRLELSKLDEYFPPGDERREIRWRLESSKLEHTFPYLISVGNLFSVVSLFESYLLLLAGEIQSPPDLMVRDVKGQGIGRLFKFFRIAGIAPESLALSDQIQAAIKIRNCLAHASGMLDWARESAELRRIGSTGDYLSPEHKARRLVAGRAFDEVRIEESPFGDRLAVSNEYSHVVCSYLSSYFSTLCEAGMAARCIER